MISDTEIQKLFEEWFVSDNYSHDITEIFEAGEKAANSLSEKMQAEKKLKLKPRLTVEEFKDILKIFHTHQDPDEKDYIDCPACIALYNWKKRGMWKKWEK